MRVPFFTWINIVREPTGSLALALSFFPPSAPMVMALRLSAMGKRERAEASVARFKGKSRRRDIELSVEDVERLLEGS